VHAPYEDKSDDREDSFCEEPRHIFDQFPRYSMKILLGDFDAKVGREDVFKPTIMNESSHKINDDNGVRVINFATSENLVDTVLCFLIAAFRNALTSPEGKMHSQIDHVLIDRRWHSSILEVQSFRGAICDTHYC
jgi:hypothetical protein